MKIRTMKIPERILQLEERYDFSLESLSEKIKKSKKKSLLLQFPDGLKQYALEISEFLQEKNKNTEIKIWLGTCFGACDIPNSDSELLIQFGHSPWKFN
jgi:2-(3-amino-3-carboxypropyl)histidine synthase